MIEPQVEPRIEVSRWRVRAEGHGALLALAGLGIVSTLMRVGMPGDRYYNYLRLLANVFPIAVGWLCGAIALEVAIARGGGRSAIQKSLKVALIASLANIVVVFAVLHYFRVV